MEAGGQDDKGSGNGYKNTCKLLYALLNVLCSMSSYIVATVCIPHAWFASSFKNVGSQSSQTFSLWLLEWARTVACKYGVDVCRHKGSHKHKTSSKTSQVSFPKQIECLCKGSLVMARLCRNAFDNPSGNTQLVATTGPDGFPFLRSGACSHIDLRPTVAQQERATG